MTSFSFNSRETYIQYRKEWVNRYAQLSAKQRADRIELKTIFRTPDFRRTSAMYKQYDILSNTRTANELLAELGDAKAEANRQYLAKKNAVEA